MGDEVDEAAKCGEVIGRKAHVDMDARGGVDLCSECFDALASKLEILEAIGALEDRRDKFSTSVIRNGDGCIGRCLPCSVGSASWEVGERAATVVATDVDARAVGNSGFDFDAEGEVVDGSSGWHLVPCG